jgi:SAM-dependent methyltransferase
MDDTWARGRRLEPAPPGGDAERIAFPRRKPRSLGAAAASRVYAAARRVVPRRALGLFLLRCSRLAHRFAWEQVWYWLPPDDALGATRPHAAGWVRQSVGTGVSVVDLGGGIGVASKVAAEKASRVLYVDQSAETMERARQNCAGLANVELVLGGALDVLKARGPFDVALLLHVLEHLDEPVDALRLVREHCRRVVVEVPDFGSDALNFIRLREGLPCYADDDHVTEFTPEYLERCLDAAGWAVSALRVQNGVILAVADRNDAHGPAGSGPEGARS